jgi:hypothetical protein
MEITNSKLYGQRCDLVDDPRSVSAMLAGHGDLRNAFFFLYERKCGQVDPCGLSGEEYRKIVLESYVATRWLPQACRDAASQITLAWRLIIR